jgi:lipopolysaccharide export system protein LptA
MGRQRIALGILLALTAAVPLQAQQRTCRQVLESDIQRRLVDSRGGTVEEIIYFRDPVRVLCTGDVRLEADSAVITRSPAGSTVELVGNVVYQDTVRRLEADWANYLGGMDQLLARGSAIIEDLQEGAVVSGDQINYLRETDTRSQARLIVTGGRPHAVLPARAPDQDTVEARAPPRQAPGQTRTREGPERPAPDPARSPAEEPSPETHVWAERLDLEGPVFRAEGDVELERGELTGTGRRAVYDQELDRMTLSGDARLATNAYRLSGDQVQAMLEGDELRQLLSWGDARAVSEDLEIRSQRIRIGFVDGELQGLEAWNVDPEAPRIWARARDFQLRADSMEAVADSIGMQELRAIGRAYGERMLADGSAGAPVDPESEGLVDVGRDWVQGDTILGFFDQVRGEPTGPDSARTVLERIEVIGGAEPALSLYRMTEDEGDSPAINFMKARRIILLMEAGDVARVEAEGPIEGLYLEAGGAPEETGVAAEEGTNRR